MKSVEPIVAEIRRLAEARRPLPPTAAPAPTAPASPDVDAGDLRRPMRLHEQQPFRRLLTLLDRLRRRALKAILIQQSEVNRAVAATTDRLAAQLGVAREERQALEDRLDALQLEIEQLQAELLELRARSARRTGAAADRDPATPLAVLPEAIKGYHEDPVSFAVEEQLRGDEETIRRRQQVHVERFRAAARATGAPVLDVGCGRGEFLELLRDAGIPARGIDLSPANVRRCKAKHLEVVQADALAYLSGVPPQSLAGVFACHVIEHVPADYLLALLRACADGIQPRGCIVLETVNPDSLATLTTFHADPSHVNPVPPLSARLLLEACGFQYVETLYLSPYPDEMLLPLIADGSATTAQMNESLRKLNQLLYAPREYAVVATR